MLWENSRKSVGISLGLSPSAVATEKFLDTPENA